MKFIRFSLITACLACTLVARGAATTRPSVEFSADQNRIVFVGSGLIEQARISGFIDYRFLRNSPDRSMICRNLGWSGDSVTGAARISGYQNPAGMGRLIKETTDLKPTMILVGYGWVESFDGPAKLAEFTADYNKLLDALGKITPNLVLISPAGEEGASPERSDDLEKYSGAIAAIADERKLPFVDLFHPFVEFEKSRPAAHLTSNGITLNDAGYWIVADEIEKQLGIQPATCSIQLQADGKILSAASAAVSDVEASDAGLKFQLHRTNLPEPQLPESLTSSGIPAEHISLGVKGLPAGQWTLVIDGKEVMQADAQEWAGTPAISIDPDRASADKLLRAVVKIDALFYRRERPFNDHPRHYGYIGGDFALYDKQLVELDQSIDALRQPKSHECKLVRSSKP